MTSADRPFGWLQVVRLGLVQAALGGLVVLMTSTLNRVMVVELALPALLPGVLVALHYLVQTSRPRMGWGSDVGGRRTPWIVGGMAVLASGALLAAAAVAWMPLHRTGGVLLAFAAFVLIGLGVAACGTTLLVLLAKRVPAPRRAAAATTVWLMMILGFAVTAGTAGHFLDPYSPARLLAVTAVVAVLAVLVALLATWGLEGPAPAAAAAAPGPQPHAPAGAGLRAFASSLAEVWAEPAARRFTVFIFVSMLAFSAQDLILEPFAGTVFGFTPGRSTQLSGVQHGGVLVGMLLAAAAGSRWRGRQFGSLAGWTAGGCIASGLALGGLVLAGLSARPGGHPLEANVFLLGAANGVFSIAAIGSMMRLAGEGRPGSEGVRIGLWGAAQALAFALGGLVGTGASDLAQALLASPGTAYAAVFGCEALLFLLAGWLAWRPLPAAGSARALPSPMQVST
ncbi:BCD family MFS transporter [Aquincola tertiaricarbonis]|uniref:BCD family MFS transporter n=1 Tax=Aquincola tertiaricarbonis TaxID=391953 RepID=UPI0006149D0C|nr:BCD family MFS transporter [Aquincola tertiaricarbonis]